MLKDLSIKNKLYLGFASIVAIILILLTLAYNNFTRLSTANGWDKHTMEVLLQADKVNNAILDIQVQVRGYYLTGDESRVKIDKDDIDELNREIEKMIALTADNPVQQERLKKLDAIAKSWFNDAIMVQVARRRALANTPGAADMMKIACWSNAARCRMKRSARCCWCCRSVAWSAWCWPCSFPTCWRRCCCRP